MREAWYSPEDDFLRGIIQGSKVFHRLSPLCKNLFLCLSLYFPSNSKTLPHRSLTVIHSRTVFPTHFSQALFVVGFFNPPGESFKNFWMVGVCGLFFSQVFSYWQFQKDIPGFFYLDWQSCDGESGSRKERICFQSHEFIFISHSSLLRIIHKSPSQNPKTFHTKTPPTQSSPTIATLFIKAPHPTTPLIRSLYSSRYIPIISQLP